ncbi:hypothetical protein F5148DRAFT_1152049 [Russula earlei]|uniref:Uncharacterized protein n=1 Tax=Russula earlei TaxID=71964 RepID=A0ACC0TZB2_9AGAM|nr:hypothetical protein F5148DRAFT_1152049 [Russula earlei]
MAILPNPPIDKSMVVEWQVKLAKQTVEEQLWASRKLVKVIIYGGVKDDLWFTALLMITWWYWCNARWVEMLWEHYSDAAPESWFGMSTACPASGQPMATTRDWRGHRPWVYGHNLSCLGSNHQSGTSKSSVVGNVLCGLLPAL